MKILLYLLPKENLLARVIALLVACGLWIYVMTEQNPITERSAQISLRQSNLPEDMMVFNMPTHVVVKVRGTRTRVNDSLDDNVRAFIDLKGTKQGQQVLPVKVDFDGGDVVSVSPDEVSVFVDSVSEKKLPVVMRVVGSVSSDMAVGHSTISPSEVTVRGATHKLEKVKEVAAPVDVSGYTGTFSVESELVAVGDDGKDTPHMQIVPDKATVEAGMVSQMLSVEVPVRLVTIGYLPDNVIVTKTELAPEKIALTAPPSVLRSLKEIYTKPVDVSTLTGSASFAVELDLPDRVIPEARTVRLNFSVERRDTAANGAKDK